MLLPKVTVILPIRNEAAHIRDSLSAVLVQDYPPERMEIIIADGMSTDNTREIVADLQRQYSPPQAANLRIVDNHGMIVPTGMNAAINQAEGEIIVRVDGHTIIERDYVRQCVEALQRTGADNVGGRMDAVTQGWVGETIALATSCPFGVGNARFHYSDKEERVDTVYLGAWPREVLQRIGLFDEEMVRNQDDELNYRLRSRGGRILLCPKIKSKYFNRGSIRALWRQYFQYGYWKVRVLQKHPRQMSVRQFIPPLFVVTLIILFFLSLFTRYGWMLLVAITGCYLISNLVVSACLARGNEGFWSRLLLFPIVFSSLHLSYGSGFLFGFIKFAHRWRRA